MQRQSQIDVFVESISDSDIALLFNRYQQCRYGHLMLNPIQLLSKTEF